MGTVCTTGILSHYLLSFIVSGNSIWLTREIYGQLTTPDMGFNYILQGTSIDASALCMQFNNSTEVFKQKFLPLDHSVCAA